MKLKITCILLALLCAHASATDKTPPQGGKRSPHASNAYAPIMRNQAAANAAAIGLASQGQTMSIDSQVVYQAQERNPVSTAVAPAIVSSNDTCMGSTSLGGSTVSFGFSAGTTWTDDNCVMLKNAREMWNMGFKGAALARMCMDPLNKEAFEATGINCPERRKAVIEERNPQSSNLAASSEPERYDHFIRH